MQRHCLALCLDAPMQSWGLRGRATIRDTATEPTKSGVVGLLCCALGVARDDTERIARLAGLRMGVRVDREGILERDYHTVQHVPTTAGTGHRTVESHRYYLADALFLVVLADALFLVVLAGELPLLQQAHTAVQQPHWPLYLGRRAFVPTRPLVTGGQAGEPRTGMGILTQDLDEVLSGHPWLEERASVRTTELRRDPRAPLRTVVDCGQTAAAAETCYDHPLTYANGKRAFRARTVRRGQVPLTDAMILAEAPACT